MNGNESLFFVDAKVSVFVFVNRLIQAGLIELLHKSRERAGVVDVAWL